VTKHDSLIGELKEELKKKWARQDANYSPAQLDAMCDAATYLLEVGIHDYYSQYI